MRSRYFDDQLWPVVIALAALGGVLIGVSMEHLPLSGDVWYRTAWPGLIGIPLFVIGLTIALALIDRRLFRRSLQLSLVLCALVHVLLALQLLRTRITSRDMQAIRPARAVREKQPPRLVPDYHRAQLVPEEERPRQDFEKPVEAQTPEPLRELEPEKVVRQPTEVEQSPAQPQPAKVPEQTATPEPNVVSRQQPNEVAPRLATDTSQLSRQMQPAQLQPSEPVALPAQQELARAEAQAAASAQARRQSEELQASSAAELTHANPQSAPAAANATSVARAEDLAQASTVPQPASQRVAIDRQPDIGPKPSKTPPRRSAVARPTVAPEASTADIASVPSTRPARPVRMADPAPRATIAMRGAEGGANSLPRTPARGHADEASSIDAGTAAPAAKLARAQLSGSGPQAQPRVADVARATNMSEMARAAPSTAPRGGSATVEHIPEVGPRSAVAQANIDHLPTGIARASLPRPPGEPLRVDIAAPTGPGGLGSERAPDVGINSRQARADSIHVEMRSTRFLRSQVGGLPAVSTAAVIPTEAFSSRAARVRGQDRPGGGGSQSPATEEAIERGLAFLARYQRADGGWSLQGFSEGASLVSDTAATALAVLAFQGAGYNHREFQYKDVVRGGIAQLLKNQRPNGDLFAPLDDASNASVWLYSHSLASIAICEAYGMTQDPALKEPAQKAIDFIVAGQHSERGGWRYAPGVGADTSVSGWMMMALKSGELAGLDVPPAAFERIARWLDAAQQSPNEPHLYRYNPYAPDTPEQRHGRVASKTMTAVGLLMRLYTGWRRDNPNMRRGAAFLLTQLPANGTARDPQRDTYYWYYATQVMAQVGGEAWQAWMNRLHPLLVSSQVRQGPLAGSWDPQAPIADRWGPHAGRLYVTTMDLLSLEVQHRKLPLYEDLFPVER